MAQSVIETGTKGDLIDDGFKKEDIDPKLDLVKESSVEEGEEITITKEKKED